VINLRYHIVSITAVFLALGIGLTLGSTFLDRVTVDTLKAQLEQLEVQVADTRERNEALDARLDRLDERDDAFASALPERLLEGRLDGVPMLVVSTRGTDEERLHQVVSALTAAGADLSGIWWLTDRWALDDEAEVRELAELLDLRTEDVDRLRRNAAIQVSELLRTASRPAPVVDAPEATQEATGEAAQEATGEAQVTDEVDGPAPTEPELVALLAESGFLEYEALSGATDPTVLLPGSDARFVVVSGTATDSGAQAFATAVVEEMAAEGPVPVLAAQGEVDVDVEDEPASEDGRRTTFVGPIRDGELTRDRVSTVDDLDTAAGLAALVLAVQDLAAPTIGHYGIAAGASTLLPGPAPEP
jgi:hypothetical protein